MKSGQGHLERGNYRCILMSEEEIAKERENEDTIAEKIIIKKDKIVVKEAEKPYLSLEEIKKEILDISELRLLEKEFIKLLKNKLTKISENAAYPEWINEPWARIRPHQKFYLSWLNKWKDVLIIYSKKHRKFLHSLPKLVSERPFYDGKSGLSIEDVRKIVDMLVQEDLARWLDEDKTNFVVYWLPISFIVELVIEAAKEAGLYLIRSNIISEVLKDIPSHDLIEILKIIVNKGYGVWVIEGRAVKLSAL